MSISIDVIFPADGPKAQIWTSTLPLSVPSFLRAGLKTI